MLCTCSPQSLSLTFHQWLYLLNSHYTMFPLNGYVSLQYNPPQWLCLPPYEEEVVIGFLVRWYLPSPHSKGEELVASLNQQIWLPTYEDVDGYARGFGGKPFSWPWRRGIRSRYSATLVPSLAHPSASRWLHHLLSEHSLLPLWWYPYPASLWCAPWLFSS